MRFGLQSEMNEFHYVMDLASEARLKDVHPLLAAKVRAMAQQLAAAGVLIRVTQGLRTWEEQEKLYAQGRSEPGETVTNAPPGSSYHNYGLAVDVVPMTATGPDWNVSHPIWRQIVEAGKSVGLDSGAMWRTFPDYPHFQLTGFLPRSPSSQVRSTFAAGGILAVWKLTGYTSSESDDVSV
jgi:peptidoglycan LD-endopeptidase CwlK